MLWQCAKCDNLRNNVPVDARLNNAAGENGDDEVTRPLWCQPCWTVTLHTPHGGILPAVETRVFLTRFRSQFGVEGFGFVPATKTEGYLSIEMSPDESGHFVHVERLRFERRQAQPEHLPSAAFYASIHALAKNGTAGLDAVLHPYDWS